jgi:hypothetical protein
MSIFDIPESLLEAVIQVTDTSWRRDLDVRPLVLIAGLSETRLHEVYHGKYSDFVIPDHDAQSIHDALSITDSLPSQAAHSLNHYTGSGYERINQSLRDSYINNAEVPNDVKRHSDNIKSILHAEKPVSNLGLFTGVKESPATTAGLEWNSTRPIKVLHLPAFTSATTSFDIAASFTEPDDTSTHHESDHHGVIESGATHILHLSFPHKIRSAASVADHGVGHEEEVLLGPNHRFELHPRPTRVDGPGGTLYVWKAKSIGVDDRPMFVPRLRQTK